MKKEAAEIIVKIINRAEVTLHNDKDSIVTIEKSIILKNHLIFIIKIP